MSNMRDTRIEYLESISTLPYYLKFSVFYGTNTPVLL